MLHGVLWLRWLFLVNCLISQAIESVYSQCQDEALCDCQSLMSGLSMSNGNFNNGNLDINGDKCQDENDLRPVSAKIFGIWHKMPFPLTNFYIEATVEMRSSETESGDSLGDGFAFIFANNATISNFSIGSPFGLKWDNFSGVAIVASPNKEAFYAANSIEVFNQQEKDCPNKDLPCTTMYLSSLPAKVVYKVRGQRSPNTINDMELAIGFNDTGLTLFLPIRGLMLQYPEFYFGVRGYCGPNGANSVDVFDISVYNCAPEETTTPAELTSSTQRTSTDPGAKRPQNAKTTQGEDSTARATTLNSSPETPRTSSGSPSPETLQASTITTRQAEETNNTPQTTRKANSKGSDAVVMNVGSTTQAPTEQLQQSFFPGGLVETSLAEVTATNLLKECTDFAPYRAAPPPSRNGNVTMVTPAFGLNRLVKLDTVNEIISIDGAIFLSWSVTTCPKNSSDFFTERPTEEIYVAKTSDVWMPAFRFMNTASSTIYMQDSEDFGDDLLATVSYENESPNRLLSFYWIKDGTFSSACKLDLGRFPFDKQTCGFTFSLLRSVSLVAFTDPQFYVPDSLGDNEWTYRASGWQKTLSHYKGQRISTINFSITFERNFGYYVTNLVLPCVVLLIVEIASFLLPPDAPDRPAFSVTVLLAVTVAQSAVAGQVPKTSARILLNDYVTALSWLCAACTLYHALTCCLATGQEPTKEELDKTGSTLVPVKRSCLAKLGIMRICDIIAATLAIGAVVGIKIYFLNVI